MIGGRRRKWLVIATVFLASCAIVPAHVRTVGDLRGPVSLSATVYDADGSPLRVGSGLEVVKHFTRGMMVWSALFGSVELTGQVDVAAIANAEMAENGGDAIVNLVVRTQTFDVTAYACAFLPVLPCSVVVWIEGDVVRASTSAAPAATSGADDGPQPGNGHEFHFAGDDAALLAPLAAHELDTVQR